MASEPRADGDTEEPVEESQWMTPYWACHQDGSLACMGAACPWCMYADNITRMEGRYTAWCPPMSACFCLSLLLLWALVGGETRRELRQTFHLPEAPCNDYLLHCLCPLCALCQEAREIKLRSVVLAPQRAAARLAGAADAPEVQFVTRGSSQPLPLAEWDWRARRAKRAAAPAPVAEEPAPEEQGAAAGALEAP